jgi:Kef-type K+ transport system membrane component KefB
MFPNNKTLKMKYSAEMGLPIILVLMLVAAVTFFVNFVGIKHYNECDAIRGVEKFENRKVYLSQLVTIVITGVVTLALRQFASSPGMSATGPMMLVVGALLLTSSVFVYQILNADKEACEPTKTDVNYSGVSMGFASVIILAGIAITYLSITKNKKFTNTASTLEAFSNRGTTQVGPLNQRGRF